MFCSESQVPLGTCGSPIDYYSVDVGTNGRSLNSTFIIVPTYTVQKIRTASQSLQRELYFNEEDVTGYFKLTYNGSTTQPISSHASENDLRDALEALPSVQTVSVSRSLSLELLNGVINAVPGTSSITCADSCDFSNLFAGDIISFEGNVYKIALDYVAGSWTIPLALSTDATIVTYYSGTPLLAVPLTRWARGFEWSVTFLSVSTIGDSNTSIVQPLSSPSAGLNPIDSSVSIRPDDCNNCFFIDNLIVWNRYSLRIRGHNKNGFGDSVSVIGIPKEVPGSPTDLALTVISGTQLELFFSPPVGQSGNITQYTVQWDIVDDFSTVYGGLATCSTSGFGQCQLYGSSISGAAPYHYVIQALSIHTLYYVRVSASNAVSPNMNTFPTTNVQWSAVISATTANQVPQFPQSVKLITASYTSLQVVFIPPNRDGGLPVVSYTISWDVSPTFNDTTTFGTITLPVASLSLLNPTTGQLIYEIDNLITGNYYWVSVVANNAIGGSVTALSSTSAMVGGKASPPSTVLVTVPSVSSSPISTASVLWSASTMNGGSPITNYLVQWWSQRSVNEVQLVQYRTITYPVAQIGQFSVSFSTSPTMKQTTNKLPWTISSFDFRSELLDMGYSDVSNTSSIILGDIAVQKTTILTRGYQWAVTFESNINAGSVPLLQVDLSGVSSNDFVQVLELTRGQRSGGQHEEQLVTIVLHHSTEISDLTGYFQMSFNGNENVTPFIHAQATGADVASSLNELNALSPVTVTRSLISGVTPFNVSYIGYQWTITFANDFGDQQAIAVDGSNLQTSNVLATIFVTVNDGDNSISSTGYKASNAVEGEFPVEYNTALVNATTTSYEITGIATGEVYQVAVSAINSFGNGAFTMASPSTVKPPFQIPQPPSSVEVNVHSGSSTQLEVSYLPPASDGGSTVLSYRVELDVTPQFLNPIHVVEPCASSNVHTVYEIHTAGSVNDPIVSGYFQLDVTFNNNKFTTDYIPYDAPATAAEELGVVLSVRGVYAILTNQSTSFATNADATASIFPGNRVQFDIQSNSKEYFTVVSVNKTHLTVDREVTFGSSVGTAVISRLLGGLGTSMTSRVACNADNSDVNLCPLSRRYIAGSVQSKFNMIPNAFTLGVEVSRDAPDYSNGMTWRVTFLDEAQSNSLDFVVSLTSGSNMVQTRAGESANITITQLTNGQVYGSCVGTFVVPGDKPLVQGQEYYARVFAINQIGYSLPAIAPSPQKPMVVPGPPTSVVLTVAGATQLRVSFNPPASDGGDTITQYQIDYSTTSTFATFSSASVTFLSGGAPFFKTITGLITGTFYYVRVSAMNSQGFGPSALSTPGSLNPYTMSHGPTSVNLYVTSDTMLTVSFQLPLNNGGDAITKYRVEWDVAIGFNTANSAPNKGYVEVDATQFNSYTIQYLTAGQVYYVRVFGINSYGLGLPTSSYPAFASPSLQIPGRPHMIQAYSGNGVGRVTVSWLRPRVPWFDVPCAGSVNAVVDDCPAAVGGGLPSSDGGSSIISYVINYNEAADFSGYDQGEVTVAASASTTTYTLTNLIPGRRYYIRVLARNTVGSGPYCNMVNSNCVVSSSQQPITVSAIATTNV